MLLPTEELVLILLVEPNLAGCIFCD